MLFLAFLILCLLMIGRNQGFGFIVVAVVWLAAMVFNPNVDSGLIWTIGFGLGYVVDISD